MEVKSSRFSLPKVVTIVEEGSVIEAEEDHMDREDSKPRDALTMVKKGILLKIVLKEEEVQATLAEADVPFSI